MTTTSDVLTAGGPAPESTLLSADAAIMRTAELWASAPVLLAFLPAPSSPFCADNAAQLRDGAQAIEEVGVRLCAVFAGAPEEAAAFAGAWNLTYQLLSDADGSARAAWLLDAGQPGSFIIDTAGVVRYVHEAAAAEAYPPLGALLEAASKVTGRKVSPPPPPPRAAFAAAPLSVQKGTLASGAYACAKCGAREYEISRVSTAGGWVSRLFNFQSRGFTAITCLRCAYTELYKTGQGGIANALDILVGR